MYLLYFHVWMCNDDVWHHDTKSGEKLYRYGKLPFIAHPKLQWNLYLGSIDLYDESSLSCNSLGICSTEYCFFDLGVLQCRPSHTRSHENRSKYSHACIMGSTNCYACNRSRNAVLVIGLWIPELVSGSTLNGSHLQPLCVGVPPPPPIWWKNS